MTESALRELEEAAPAPFEIGDQGDKHRRAARPQRAPRRQPRLDPPPRAQDQSNTANGSYIAWPDGLANALRLQEAWRLGVTMLAREQLAYVADVGSDFVAAGKALAAEPDPVRRAELVCAQALRQLERSLEASARLVESLASPGRDMLEAACRHRQG